MNVVNNQIRFKTPYQAAVVGGYIGTEEQFIADLGKLSALSGVCDRTEALISDIATEVQARTAADTALQASIDMALVLGLD